MFNLLGAIGLSLSTDKSSYRVGDTVVYVLQGGLPGARVAWSSFKNGQSTGEYQADYGQVIGANGTVELPASAAFTDLDKGSWQKIALVINSDGTTEQVQTSFNVSPATVAPPPGSVNASTDFFSGSVTLPVIGSVSKPVAIGGAALLAYFLLSGKGRR